MTETAAISVALDKINKFKYHKSIHRFRYSTIVFQLSKINSIQYDFLENKYTVYYGDNSEVEIPNHLWQNN